MRLLPAARRYSSLLAAFGLLVLLCAFFSPAQAATIVRFTLDRKIDGAAVPFVLATSRGLYRAENLEVTTNTVTTASEAFARLAKGDSDIALVDFNDLIRYRDNGTAPLKAVFILHNDNGYAIAARRSRGVDGVTDLQGKTLGVAEGDLSIRMWPAISRRIGFDASKVKLEKIGSAVREPMLSAGQVDAVAATTFASALNLRDRGVPASDLVIIRFADFGDRSYGQALVVNPAFAAANAAAVTGFIKATINGIRLALKDPVLATDDVLAQMDGGSRALELERVRSVLRENIVTPEVRRDGIGGITSERFDASVEQIAADFKFRHRPTQAEVFDGAFLPPAPSRKID